MSYSHEYNAIESLIGCAYHEAALKMHLADSELCILYTLHTHGPGCLQSTLYKETGLTKTTVNSALKKLEKGGTLYLTPGPGRNTRVYLTESGAQLARDTAGGSWSWRAGSTPAGRRGAGALPAPEPRLRGKADSPRSRRAIKVKEKAERCICTSRPFRLTEFTARKPRIN